jgi:hypothetical protein
MGGFGLKRIANRAGKNRFRARGRCGGLFEPHLGEVLLSGDLFLQILRGRRAQQVGERKQRNPVRISCGGEGRQMGVYTPSVSASSVVIPPGRDLALRFTRLWTRRSLQVASRSRVERISRSGQSRRSSKSIWRRRRRVNNHRRRHSALGYQAPAVDAAARTHP